ncbi:MAG: hypothetical protein R3F11_02550 [Verrucomicrobiales bacterium]
MAPETQALLAEARFTAVEFRAIGAEVAIKEAMPWQGSWRLLRQGWKQYKHAPQALGKTGIPGKRPA